MADTQEIKVVPIKIMGRELKIKCPQDKLSELTTATNYLNKKMEEIYRNDKFATIDRVAITAALNITHELIATKTAEESPSNHNLSSRLGALKNKLQQALANGK